MLVSLPLDFLFLYLLTFLGYMYKGVCDPPNWPVSKQAFQPKAQKNVTLFGSRAAAGIISTHDVTLSWEGFHTECNWCPYFFFKKTTWINHAQGRAADREREPVGANISRKPSEESKKASLQGFQVITAPKPQ